MIFLNCLTRPILAALTDAAIADGCGRCTNYLLLEKTLVLMEEGLDYEIID